MKLILNNSNKLDKQLMSFSLLFFPLYDVLCDIIVCHSPLLPPDGNSTPNTSAEFRYN